MNYTGTIEITDELTLKDPSMEVKTIIMDLVNDKVIFEVIFKEAGGLYEHSRDFEFDNSNGNSLSVPNINGLINSNSVLKKFK